jgi:hypothetical protein
LNLWPHDVVGKGPRCVPNIILIEEIYFMKFIVAIYHNPKITMSKCEFSMKSMVDLGNLTKPTIRGFVSKGT